jgi:COP9 signalosome complex subunit 5
MDPIRSLVKNRIELMAFRVYPPDYSSPVSNQTPDGTIVTDDSKRVRLWGSCWERYYR